MFDLGRTFIQSVEREPQAVAIVDGESRLTYESWLDSINALANGLNNAGLRRGDRLVVVLKNGLNMASIHWACQFLGAIVTPLNWRATAEDIDFCLADSGARLIVFDADCAAAIVDSIFAKKIPKYCTSKESILEVEDFQSLHADSKSQILRAEASDYSVMLYTSGTTGKPKGVPRTHIAEKSSAMAHVLQNQYEVREVTLGVMPMYHTMGVRSLLAMALVNGCFVNMSRFNVDKALKLIQEESVTSLYLVPTLYHDIIQNNNVAKTNFNSVKRIGFAGAPMTEGLVAKVQSTFNPDLFVNHYGSSEIYTFSINKNVLAKPKSAGRSGINGRLRIVKLDSTNPDDIVEAKEEGQIISDAKSDEAFQGYWNRPDADSKSLKGGWYFTGDTGFFDDDGDLYVTGRVDDMIISGGENITPVEIESVLSLHPAVKESAVVGVKDNRWGQIVVAFVVVKDKLVDWKELDQFIQKSSLSHFKRPREYKFIKEIPKSPVGKVLRRKLIAGEFDLVNSE